MENKVLTTNLSNALEVLNAEQLVALNIRIGHVLRRTPISVAQNPFRPELFVSAVMQAWTEFETSKETHHLVLGLLQPELFLHLQSVYQGLNDALIERGILVDIESAKKEEKKRFTHTRVNDKRPQNISCAPRSGCRAAPGQLANGGLWRGPITEVPGVAPSRSVETCARRPGRQGETVV